VLVLQKDASAGSVRQNVSPGITRRETTSITVPIERGVLVLGVHIFWLDLPFLKLIVIHLGRNMVHHLGIFT